MHSKLLYLSLAISMPLCSATRANLEDRDIESFEHALYEREALGDTYVNALFERDIDSLTRREDDLPVLARRMKRATDGEPKQDPPPPPKKPRSRLEIPIRGGPPPKSPFGVSSISDDWESVNLPPESPTSRFRALSLSEGVKSDKLSPEPSRESGIWWGSKDESVVRTKKPVSKYDMSKFNIYLLDWWDKNKHKWLGYRLVYPADQPLYFERDPEVPPETETKTTDELSDALADFLFGIYYAMFKIPPFGYGELSRDQKVYFRDKFNEKIRKGEKFKYWDLEQNPEWYDDGVQMEFHRVPYELGTYRAYKAEVAEFKQKVHAIYLDALKNKGGTKPTKKWPIDVEIQSLS